MSPFICEKAASAMGFLATKTRCALPLSSGEMSFMLSLSLRRTLLRTTLQPIFLLTEKPTRTPPYFLGRYTSTRFLVACDLPL